MSNVVSTNSDRIIAIQFSISNGNCLSVVSVYLRTSDTPISCYREVLNELENVVMGDFIIPVVKGKGRDPLNYRGITLTSVQNVWKS